MALPEFFGVDIGNHTIKVAKVKYQGNRVVIQKLGNIPTPYGAGDLDSEESINAVVGKIKEIKTACGITTDKVIAALPESVIFSRVIEIPKTDDEKVEETVYWEARQYIPIPIEEVQLDWIEIQEKNIEGNKYLQLLLVAAPKKTVKTYQEVMSKAGLELIALETESVATSRIVSYKSTVTEPMMILDFGANGTDMSVIKGTSLVFSQTLGTGSDALTKAIANDYGITEEQAEQYKRAYGLLEDQGEGKIAKSLFPVMDIIVNEVNKTINFFKAHMQEGTPQKLIIVGDGAKLLGLTEYMKKTLGIESQLVTFDEKLFTVENAPKEKTDLTLIGFTVACGLAMKTE